MSGPVDVLGVLEQAADTCPDRLDWDLREARAAVAELIDADREYDVARAYFSVATGKTGCDPATTRLAAAQNRRAVALARVQVAA